jgi:hypothetical protein
MSWWWRAVEYKNFTSKLDRLGFGRSVINTTLGTRLFQPISALPLQPVRLLHCTHNQQARTPVLSSYCFILWLILCHHQWLVSILYKVCLTSRQILCSSGVWGLARPLECHWHTAFVNFAGKLQEGSRLILKIKMTLSKEHLEFLWSWFIKGVGFSNLEFWRLSSWFQCINQKANCVTSR